nr:L,D-transpeptidase family protein [Streptomyces sp. NBC_00830]
MRGGVCRAVPTNRGIPSCWLFLQVCVRAGCHRGDDSRVGLRRPEGACRLRGLRRAWRRPGRPRGQGQLRIGEPVRLHLGFHVQVSVRLCRAVRQRGPEDEARRRHGRRRDGWRVRRADVRARCGAGLSRARDIGNATQVITVKAGGSYATVTAWQKGSSGWKAQFSTSAGRVGSNGVVDGATRQQSTYTTPSGTYTITEGFGVESGGTAMPYTKVDDRHWWVQDPESKFYNQMHTAEGADFPLSESGERGSEHLINYPTQYAKALVINFNRWPAVPGRGAGIFLHVTGNGATAGCVSVPRATMDRFMGWVKPSANPRIAIG